MVQWWRAWEGVAGDGEGVEGVCVRRDRGSEGRSS